MNGGFIDIVGPDLHHVPGINHHGVFDHGDVVPISITMNLEAANLILQQNSQATRVRVMVNSKIGIGLIRMGTFGIKL